MSLETFHVTTSVPHNESYGAVGDMGEDEEIDNLVL